MRPFSIPLYFCLACLMACRASPPARVDAAAALLLRLLERVDRGMSPEIPAQRRLERALVCFSLRPDSSSAWVAWRTSLGDRDAQEFPLTSDEAAAWTRYLGGAPIVWRSLDERLRWSPVNEREFLPHLAPSIGGSLPEVMGALREWRALQPGWLRDESHDREHCRALWIEVCEP